VQGVSASRRHRPQNGSGAGALQLQRCFAGFRDMRWTMCFFSATDVAIARHIALLQSSPSDGMTACVPCFGVFAD
jgi:hypothetical protein